VSPRGTGLSSLVPIVIVIGAGVAALNAMDLLAVAATARWPVAPGMMTAAAITQDMVGYTSARSGRWRIIAPRLHVTYTYTVAGQQYTSSQYSILVPSTREATARALREHAAGQSVVVHYDPENRASAVLDTSVPGGRVLLVILGVGMAVGAWAATRAREADT
jgi:hypothetical protein